MLKYDIFISKLQFICSNSNWDQSATKLDKYMYTKSKTFLQDTETCEHKNTTTLVGTYSSDYGRWYWCISMNIQWA